MAVTAMFPLGTVLMPGVALPLRIFEDRYVRMLADVSEGDGQFGIVLIERGSEVGGGDERFDVGTLARIIRHDQLPNGQHAIVVGGGDRIHVERWAPDDPYPRAEVRTFPERSCDPAELSTRYAEAITRLRRVLARATEAGLAVPPATFETATDPVAGSHLLAALAPVVLLDRQRLLAAPGPIERLELLATLLDDAETAISSTLSDDA